VCIVLHAVEEQTRKNSNFPVREIFKNPREIIVNILYVLGKLRFSSIKPMKMIEI
jgi:hypothetical protein